MYVIHTPTTDRTTIRLFLLGMTINVQEARCFEPCRGGGGGGGGDVEEWFMMEGDIFGQIIVSNYYVQGLKDYDVQGDASPILGTGDFKLMHWFLSRGSKASFDQLYMGSGGDIPNIIISWGSSDLTVQGRVS